MNLSSLECGPACTLLITSSCLEAPCNSQCYSSNVPFFPEGGLLALQRFSTLTASGSFYICCRFFLLNGGSQFSREKNEQTRILWGDSYLLDAHSHQQWWVYRALGSSFVVLFCFFLTAITSKFWTKFWIKMRKPYQLKQMK